MRNLTLVFALALFAQGVAANPEAALNPSLALAEIQTGSSIGWAIPSQEADSLSLQPRQLDALNEKVSSINERINRELDARIEALNGPEMIQPQ